MILVDTSIWIDHLRQSDPALSGLLSAGRVLAHPCVTGEIALGSLAQRDVILSALRDLPQANVATHDEVFHVIGRHALFGLGIGFVDAHLLAAVLLTQGASLWTRDKRLRSAAKRLKLATVLAH